MKQFYKIAANKKKLYKKQLRAAKRLFLEKCHIYFQSSKTLLRHPNVTQLKPNGQMKHSSGTYT